MKTKKLAIVRAFIIALPFIVAQPAWAVRQEGTPDLGEGLTALQTALYFVIAPLGLFLTIVVVGYAIHRPRDGKSKRTNVLSEIK